MLPKYLDKQTSYEVNRDHKNLLYLQLTSQLKKIRNFKYGSFRYKPR